MNSAKFLFSVLAIGLSGLFPAQGNDCIAFPQGNAAWSIVLTASPNSKASGAAPHIIKIDVTQSSDFRRTVLTFADNKTQEDWSITGTDLFLSNDVNGTVAIIPTNWSNFIPFTPSSFDWVQAGCRQEKDAIEYAGKMCFHYKSVVTFSPTRGAQARKGETLTGEAWVDSKTLLPVAFDDGETLATFTFLPRPTTPLAMPPKYKRLYDGYKLVMGIPRSSRQ